MRRIINVLLLLTFLSAFWFCAHEKDSSVVSIGAIELYNSRVARQVRLSLHKDAVILEGRNFEAPFIGIIESDCIDPLDMENLTIRDQADIKSIRITAEASIPDGASLDLYYSFGNSFYSLSGWTDWEKAKDLNFFIKNPKGQYCRFRLLLSAPAIDKSPLIKFVTIEAVYKQQTDAFQKDIVIQQLENEELITSQFGFEYERPDNKELAELVKQMGYDARVANIKSDLEKLLILNTVVAKTPNPDHSGWPDNYPFDPGEICSMQNGEMVIKGHCMSYAAVLINTLTSFGYYSRHWAANGLRDMDHEVVEVWVDSLRKWIYLDPSLSQYYLDPQTRIPLSIKEMHDIYTNFVLESGETFHSVSDETLKNRVKAKGPEKGMLAPIVCVDSGWHYGSKVNPATYDWGWFHGYMVSGFIRMTDRNNYISKKEPWFSDFGNGINQNKHLHWVDDATPPRTDIIQTYTGRERDLWWSLNQAAFKATRTGENSISMEFGNTQPFFKHYLLSIDDKAEVQVSANLYAWVLHSGENDIVVTPEDEYGNRGISSHLKVKKW